MLSSGKALNDEVTLQEEFLGGPNSRSASKLDDSQKGWSTTNSLAVGSFPKGMLESIHPGLLCMALGQRTPCTQRAYQPDPITSVL